MGEKMNEGSMHGRKRDAFLLFEDGSYGKSYEMCREIIEGEDDPSISILSAMNLFHMGRLDEAEAYFKDLVCRMPESSYIHSYLGRVLEMKGDEQAITHYARAVILDPENQDALRSYAAYILSSGDPGAAISVLRRLSEISGKDEDFRSLIQALLASGEPGEALALYEKRKGAGIADIEYIRILLSCGEIEKVLEVAGVEMEKSNNPLFARYFLRALSKKDPAAALSRYPPVIRSTGDPDIALDHILLLKKQGRYQEAIDECTALIEGHESDKSGISLLSAELYALAGEREKALEEYRRLIKSLLVFLSDPGLLGRALSSFRTFLLTYYPRKTAVPVFLDIVSGQSDVVCLLETARFYEELGDPTEARSWHYRAYRSDYLEGGCEYARFLAAQKDFRECEKVMLYVVNNIRKTPDLIRISRMIVMDNRLFRLKRLLDRLIQRLESRVTMLNSLGQEYLAKSFLYAASRSLEENDFPGCKESCLKGLDIIPPRSRDITPADFLELLEACKERTLYDIPIFHTDDKERPKSEIPAETLHAILDLDENERKIVDFLKAHGRANEMDLRTLLGTRRAAGYVNRVLQKSAAKGVWIIEKKGVGQYGEIYEYCGA
jgi:tetratricopeptide (TPR) repeat protein